MSLAPHRMLALKRQFTHAMMLISLQKHASPKIAPPKITPLRKWSLSKRYWANSWFGIIPNGAKNKRHVRRKILPENSLKNPLSNPSNMVAMTSCGDEARIQAQSLFFREVYGILYIWKKVFSIITYLASWWIWPRQSLFSGTVLNVVGSAILTIFSATRRP